MNSGIMGTETPSFKNVATCAIFVLSLTLGTKGQKNQTVIMDIPINGTECAHGMRDGDRLIVTGTLIGVSEVNLTAWPALQFNIKEKHSPNFGSICTMNLLTCKNAIQNYCYCTDQNADVYEVVLNMTGRKEWSEAEIKLTWTRVRSPPDVIHSNVDFLPTIYATNSEVLVLTVNGKHRTNQSCELEKGVSEYNISYCCTNSPSPCNLHIQFDSVEVTGSSCINQTFPVVASSMYTFSHSVCDTKYNTVDILCSVGPLILPSQQVTLHTSIKDTGCTQGVREGDAVMLTGSITGASGINLSAWERVEFLTNADDNINFKTACALSLAVCSNTSSSDCYCLAQSPDVYELYYKLKAQTVFSGADAKIVWRKVLGMTGVVESVTTEALPLIYGRNSEVITLRVDGKLKSNKHCKLQKGAREYRINYCCAKSPSPCNLRIKFNGGGVIGRTCINRALTTSDKYTFSYSVCDTKFKAGEFQCTVARSAGDVILRPETITAIIVVSVLGLPLLGVFAACCCIILGRREKLPPPPSSLKTRAAIIDDLQAARDKDDMTVTSIASLSSSASTMV